MNSSFITMLLTTLLLSPLFLWGESSLKNLIQNSQFGIGPEYVHVNLHVHSAGLMPAAKFNGNTGGGTAFYEYNETKGIHVNVNGYWIGGPIRGGGVTRHFSDKRIEGRLGYHFILGCSQKWVVIPYAGFGYSNIRQTNVGPSHATTRTPTYYVPIGCIVTYSISDCVHVGTNIRWTPQVDATFKTSAIEHGRWALEKKYGLIVELPFTYKIENGDLKGSIGLIPYWRHLKKGSGSLVSTTGVETPIASQIYNFWGLRLIFAFSF